MVYVFISWNPIVEGLYKCNRPKNELYECKAPKGHQGKIFKKYIYPFNFFKTY